MPKSYSVIEIKLGLPKSEKERMMVIVSKNYHSSYELHLVLKLFENYYGDENKKKDKNY